MTHPFQPGARVAVIRDGYIPVTAREAFVDKVYKNGNFTLKGDVGHRQWRPRMTRDVGSPAAAYRTGQPLFSISRSTIWLWDETADGKIQEIHAAAALWRKREILRRRLDCFPRDLPEATIDAINTCLDGLAL